MAESPIEQLSRGLDLFGRLVAGVRDDQWPAPTPCTEWTVADLVGHVIGGNLLFAAALHGERAEPAPPGPDLAAAWHRSAASLLAAFDLPGALERVVTVPFGTVPGVAALHLRLVEALVHGWDLAQSTGQRPPDAPDLAEQELAFTQAQLGRIPPGRTPFAPPQPVADHAPALDRLVACLGRRVETAVEP